MFSIFYMTLVLIENLVNVTSIQNKLLSMKEFCITWKANIIEYNLI